MLEADNELTIADCIYRKNSGKTQEDADKMYEIYVACEDRNPDYATFPSHFHSRVLAD